MFSAFFTGFSIAFGLILAIGAQNAFVLRTGIKGEHIGAIVAFCALSDAILIFTGVYGASALIETFPKLKSILILAGIIFLIVYGFSRLKSAFQGETQNPAQDTPKSLKNALITCAGFTFLNPHVYLDTWVLMGSLALPYQGEAKLSFALGASFSSLVFFSALGFGAKALRPLFQNPRAWQILDIAIALLMFALALSLIQTLQK